MKYQVFMQDNTFEIVTGTTFFTDGGLLIFQDDNATRAAFRTEDVKKVLQFTSTAVEANGAV